MDITKYLENGKNTITFVPLKEADKDKTVYFWVGNREITMDSNKSDSLRCSNNNILTEEEKLTNNAKNEGGGLLKAAWWIAVIILLSKDSRLFKRYCCCKLLWCRRCI